MAETTSISRVEMYPSMDQAATCSRSMTTCTMGKVCVLGERGQSTIQCFSRGNFGLWILCFIHTLSMDACLDSFMRSFRKLIGLNTMKLVAFQAYLKQISEK